MMYDFATALLSAIFKPYNYVYECTNMHMYERRLTEGDCDFVNRERERQNTVDKILGQNFHISCRS